MDLVLIVATTLIALFVLAFLTRRRFGALGLALAAGAMLSSLWAETLTPLIAKAGFTSTTPPLITIVSVGLTLAPAILLLFSGPSYPRSKGRVVGAALFAILALAFLIEPLGSAFILVGGSKQIYDFFLTNRVYIVSAGLVVAIFDLLSAHTTRRGGKL